MKVLIPKSFERFSQIGVRPIFLNDEQQRVSFHDGEHWIVSPMRSIDVSPNGIEFVLVPVLYNGDLPVAYHSKDLHHQQELRPVDESEEHHEEYANAVSYHVRL